MSTSRTISSQLSSWRALPVLGLWLGLVSCAGADDEGVVGAGGSATVEGDTSNPMGSGGFVSGAGGSDTDPASGGSAESGASGGASANSGTGSGGMESNGDGDGDGDMTGDGDSNDGSGGSSSEPGGPALGSNTGDGTGCEQDQVVDACGICDGDGSTCECYEDELCAEIVFEHNEVRRLINLGQFSGQPAANPPIAMVGWDPLIADKAQEWADSMDDWSVGHSTSQFRTYQSTHYSGYHGENLAIGGGVYAEPHEFVYKAWCESEAQGCQLRDCGGHYTQVVWRNSVWIGCGRKDDVPFESQGKMYKGTLTACHYGPGGNLNNNNPY